MEEVLDHLEEEGDGPLHLEGEGVAVKPDSDDEEALEVKKLRIVTFL